MLDDLKLCGISPPERHPGQGYQKTCVMAIGNSINREFFFIREDPHQFTDGFRPVQPSLTSWQSGLFLGMGVQMLLSDNMGLQSKASVTIPCMVQLDFLQVFAIFWIDCL